MEMRRTFDETVRGRGGGGRSDGAVMGTNVVNTLAVEATAALAAALISFTVARVVVGVALISFTVARVVVCIAQVTGLAA